MTDTNPLFTALRTAASGLSAERTRIDVIAQNIANTHTTRMPDGSGPYRRRVAHFEPLLHKAESGQTEIAGVRISKIAPDEVTPFEQVYDPSHPDADASGMVLFPNVNATREMADLITAMRSYEANITVQETFVQMAERSLRLAQ